MLESRARGEGSDANIASLWWAVWLGVYMYRSIAVRRSW